MQKTPSILQESILSRRRRNRNNKNKDPKQGQEKFLKKYLPEVWAFKNPEKALHEKYKKLMKALVRKAAQKVNQALKITPDKKNNKKKGK